VTASREAILARKIGEPRKLYSIRGGNSLADSLIAMQVVEAMDNGRAREALDGVSSKTINLK